MKIVIDSMYRFIGVSWDIQGRIRKEHTFFNQDDEEISLWRQEGDELIVPRGDFLQNNLDLFEGAIVVDGRVDVPAEFQLLNNITLRDYQEERRSIGIIQLPPGAGKTITALELIRRKGQRAIILTHSRELMRQWQDEIKKLMNIEAGTIGGSGWCEGEQVTIAMLQTLFRLPEKLQELVGGYGLVLVEEAHHVGEAETYNEVLNQFPALYRFGITATPFKRSGLDILIHRHVGPIIAEVSPSVVEQEKGILPITVKVLNSGFEPYAGSWTEYITQLTEDPARNNLIVQTAKRAAESHPTLILSDRVAHVERLAEMLGGEVIVIHGELRAKVRRERMEQIHQSRLVVATSGTLGEGVDLPEMGVLVMASPISSKIKLLQAVGRVIRPAPGKLRGYVADIHDDCGFSGASLRNRLGVYRERGFQVVR